MLGYILRRLMVAIPTILLIITISVLVITAAPGSPFDAQEGAELEPEIIQICAPPITSTIRFWCGWANISKVW